MGALKQPHIRRMVNMVEEIMALLKKVILLIGDKWWTTED
jgi:hypothetical protein